MMETGRRVANQGFFTESFRVRSDQPFALAVKGLWRHEGNVLDAQERTFMLTEHTALLQFVDDKAVKRGSFTLASGLVSDYYIDGKQITSDPRGLRLLADAIRAELTGYSVDAIGGLEIGAIPIAAAVAMASLEWDSQIPAFTVRKEKKGHGSRKQIEGILPQGSQVVVVDDVVTTGGSIVQAIEAIQSAGSSVVVALTMVDRDSGARKALEDCGVPYRPLLTIADLGLSNERTSKGPVPPDGVEGE